MCGRFTLTTPESKLEQRFQMSLDLPYAPNYNTAPTQSVIGIISKQGSRQVTHYRWGLIPFWAKDQKIGSRLINARAETLHEKPSFRHLFKRKRCIILSDGFYEWKRIGNSKQPYYIRMIDHSPFAFAGLWDTWKKGEQEIHSCTIITTQPNRLMESIHHRMPVILPQEYEDQWLDEKLIDKEALQSLLVPYTEPKMEAYPVSTMVNSPKNNNPDLLERI
ncbi:Putative SOS response-associated peptidase YedK [Seinonella peptonophila]|uniref:Abasic site processing protein n=1 Tax=Seinonella peptonophila TaxID=112248 RepID=A0A1M4SJH1_9BACL|nr:SOS response-associated peptidase [Seinonella peptonophila]SHE32302.1 Putative SOS response-associated peptidase YedK [Seinonella peptonophila]